VCGLKNDPTTFSSSVQYPAMGVALYRWGVMAQSNSSSDSSLGEESLHPNCDYSVTSEPS